MEIIEDRDYGASGQICPLFFDGAVSTFNELPLPNDTRSIQQIYKYIDNLDKSDKSFFLYTFKKLINRVCTLIK